MLSQYMDELEQVIKTDLVRPKIQFAFYSFCMCV